MGTLVKDEHDSLEWKFTLPPESRYRPGFAVALIKELKTFKTWEPNEERPIMFRNHRFIFVGEKGHEVNYEYRTLVTRGQGECDTFTVTNGAVKWRKALSKAKASVEGRNGLLVLVADPEATELAAGKDSWGEIVLIAKE